MGFSGLRWSLILEVVYQDSLGGSIRFHCIFFFFSQLALYFHLQEAIEKSLNNVAKATTDCLFGSMATSQPTQLVRMLHNLEHVIVGEKKRSQLLKASARSDFHFVLKNGFKKSLKKIVSLCTECSSKQSTSFSFHSSCFCCVPDEQ